MAPNSTATGSNTTVVMSRLRDFSSRAEVLEELRRIARLAKGSSTSLEDRTKILRVEQTISDLSESGEAAWGHEQMSLVRSQARDCLDITQERSHGADAVSSEGTAEETA